MPATLYVVGTPIGNLEDLSPRAARVLREVALVAAEDTRVTRRLLAHIGAHPRLVSFHEHNWRERLEQVLQALEEGDVALVSDAGMPGVSDPGRQLVAAAAARGIRVESVPGPSAVTTALAVSGLPADAFMFLGFLPRRRRERQEKLREAAASSLTLVLFEAPHRLRATLEDISAIFGDLPIAVCRELTKLHEEVFRGTARGSGIGTLRRSARGVCAGHCRGRRRVRAISGLRDCPPVPARAAGSGGPRQGRCGRGSGPVRRLEKPRLSTMAGNPNRRPELSKVDKEMPGLLYPRAVILESDDILGL